jgi:colanic acid biosynthesis glycosyl transferase WcaI
MRILICSQFFWPENFRVNDFARLMVERGHDVTVLTGEPNYPEGAIYPDYRADPCSFTRFAGADILRCRVIPRGRSKAGMILNYLSFALSGSLLAWRKLRNQRFDAIFAFQTSPITQALPAIVVRRHARAPLFLWVLDLWPETLRDIGVLRGGPIYSVIKRLVAFVYRRCDRILIQSPAMAPSIADHAGTAERTRLFPGWAEAEFAGGPADAAPEMTALAGRFRILFAGNIGEAQDFPALVEAAALLRDEQKPLFVILGEGRGADAARTAITERGLDHLFLFLGRRPLSDMPGFFAGADALLVTLAPGAVFDRTIPGKVQSYMAAARPILAMMNGEGARVITASGGGIAVPARDAAGLADAVRRLMAMTAAERVAMGEAARVYGAEEFDRLMLGQRFEQWVSEIAALPPRALTQGTGYP